MVTAPQTGGTLLLLLCQRHLASQLPTQPAISHEQHERRRRMNNSNRYTSKDKDNDGNSGNNHDLLL